MRPSHLITTQASLPPRLAPLEELARNLAWTWDDAAWQLFRQLDPVLWDQTNHSPLDLLRLVDQRVLDRAATDPAYQRELDQVAGRLLSVAPVEQPTIAYFSAEFGLSECLPIYAGGLGILAGDHLKAASDHGLPLAGIGLFYRQAYFKQILNDDGWQLEVYPNHEPTTLPLAPARDRRGAQLTLRLQYPGREVRLRVWLAQVGRVPLYLLDTDFEPNEPIDRDLTRRLYGGDRDLRLRQEILLGIGGLRVVRALGLQPATFHLNEGHAAFLAFERIRELMRERRLTFPEARLAASPGPVFTTHTPVPAGNDAFPASMLDQYFEDYYRDMGISRADFLSQGRQDVQDENEPFSMTILALKLCGASNAVSQLHGVVARRMWHQIWPDLPPEAAPIGSVTNGVHLPSWVASEMAPWSGKATTASRRDDDAELWRSHELLRGRLIDFARQRLAVQLERRGAGPAELSRAAGVLDPQALTIGFARRFAGYKRATLLLSEPERLARLVSQPGRPVQFIFAGKAHPHDEGGKELIREVIKAAARAEFRPRLVFLEDYDVNVARHLVQGVDVWMNTPRRPLEASGTSGMKAVANGGIHLSTLDGWWDEAFAPGLGWAVGDRRDYQDAGQQDQVDRASLFDLLEREVVPLFYERDAEGLPRGWLSMVRASLAQLPPRFSTDRMVAEYNERYYRPAQPLATRLAGSSPTPVRRLAAWLARIEPAWAGVQVEQLKTDASSVQVGAPLRAEATICLNGLRPNDVAADLLYGPVDDHGDLIAPCSARLEPTGPRRADRVSYRSEPLTISASGTHGLLVRLTPNHPDLLPGQAQARARWGP